MELMQTVLENFRMIFSWSTLRGFFVLLSSFFMYVVSFISDVSHPSLPFLFGLLVFDFIMGAGIALKEDRFTWAGFCHGMGKFLAYGLIFFVTGVADAGMGAGHWYFNLTVAVSVYAIAGESISCLRHIDFIFPGLLPKWIIERLMTLREGIEKGQMGMQRRGNDWRGSWRTQDKGRRQQDWHSLWNKNPDNTNNTEEK